ncbi:MAG: glucokinase [Candidatus Dactylopiibacterium sp.]|nr:glucokinase [Candidatus Dactylopiibacterium sp.]
MYSGPAETFPRLLGDIGGTNARFALVREAGAPVSDIRQLAAADFAGPFEAVQAYLAGLDVASPRRAAIGIANPITGDWLQMTNHSWAFSIEALRQQLGLDRLRFLNDFTALALALPHLAADEREQVGGGAPAHDCAIGVIGPGTGLGVSSLAPDDGQWIPLPGEGGHVTLAAQTDEEMAVVRVFARAFGHVSAERVLSGPGLVALHQALAEVRGITAAPLEAAEITRAALAGSDALCLATLQTFCALLGGTAGNLALTLGARGGIYIGGGIVPRLGSFFAASPFRERFEAKGRFRGYLAAIPTYVIQAAAPALTGAAAALQAEVSREARHFPTISSK